jgi:rsbT co-antagonist protein RsbR
MTQEEQREMKDFWEVYDGHYDQIAKDIMKDVSDQPEFNAIFKSMSPEQMANQNRASLKLLRGAVMGGDWETYVADLKMQGANYAQAGISFGAWFDIVGSFRKHLIPHMTEAYGKRLERLVSAINGMNKLVDIAMSTIAQAYVETKERIIKTQQKAILELSMPIIEVWDGIAMVPLIGVLDSSRAKQLTESVLDYIGQTKTSIVVTDISGITAVDTKTASHIIRTIQAIRLMGSDVVVTGIRPDVATTLVTLGIDLSGILTRSKLREGLEYAFVKLGLKIGKDSAT